MAAETKAEVGLATEQAKDAVTVEHANAGVQRAVTRARSGMEDAPRSLQRTVTQVERELMEQEYQQKAHVIEMGSVTSQSEEALIKAAHSSGSGRFPLDVQESGDSTSSESAPLIQQHVQQASRFATQVSRENVANASAATAEIKSSMDEDD
ncbi:hypothetical protein WJX84_012281 [Apatococcus fuscideae]|uniref:Uncharacterized protein n=1 Tax=Apatococcus fuscideae TaxID=2026836 RepID=A0AAW1RWB0_9CHLO